MASAQPPTPARRTLPDLTQMGIWRAVWVLGIPGVVRSFLASIIQISNLVVVGHLGPEAIAAVGIGNRVLFVIVAVLGAVTVGTTALVARAIGQRDAQRAAAVIHQSMLFGLIVGGLLALAGAVFSGAIVHVLLLTEPSPDKVLHDEAVAYMVWSLVPMIFGVISFVGTAIFQAAGDITTPLWVLTGSDLLNLGLAYLLVYGVGPIHSLGVAGAGLASGMARAAASVACVLILLRRTDMIRWRPAGWRIERRTMAEILDIGIPSGLENCFRQASFILFTVVIAALGTDALAASQIAQNMQSVVFNIGFGFGAAATALVGQNLGAGRPDRAAACTYAANWVSAALSALVSAAFYVFAVPMTRMYTADPSVIHLTVVCVQISALSLIFNSVSLVMAGGLRGAGDTRWVMYITAAGTWCLRLGLAVLFGIVLKGGLPGVWYAVAADAFGRGVLTYLRFRKGAWVQVFHRQEARRSGAMAAHAASAAM